MAEQTPYRNGLEEDDDDDKMEDGSIDRLKIEKIHVKSEKWSYHWEAVTAVK
jgi:hypothetical protein